MCLSIKFGVVGTNLTFTGLFALHWPRSTKPARAVNDALFKACVLIFSTNH